VIASGAIASASGRVPSAAVPIVAADRIYCHYLPENEEMVREHAERGGFPRTKVSEVKSVIDPITATLQNV
jgi:hypothetical protein